MYIHDLRVHYTCILACSIQYNYVVLNYLLQDMYVSVLSTGNCVQVAARHVICIVQCQLCMSAMDVSCSQTSGVYCTCIYMEFLLTLLAACIRHVTYI